MIATLIIEQAKDQGMKVVIPPRKNRKIQREYISRTLQIAALGRKRLLASKEVARYRHKIRENPDKRSGKSESFIREMNERFKDTQKAYEWLGVYGI